MKYFWFTFSIFIFFLAATPCCDDEKQANYTHASVAGIENHGHGSHDHQPCSPFCVCACCGSHGCNLELFQLATFESVLLQQPVEKEISQYTFQFISKFEASIWQPPKLS